MLCYSTGSLPDSCTLDPHPAVVADELAYWLAPTPFRALEWVIRPEHLGRSDDKGWWAALRIALSARGLIVSNVHLGYPLLLSSTPHAPSLASLVPRDRERKAAAALSAGLIARQLHCPYLTLTTGPAELNGRGAMPLEEMERLGYSLPSPPFAPGAASPDAMAQWQALHRSLSGILSALPPSVSLLIEQEPEMVAHTWRHLFVLGQTYPGRVFANYDVGHGAVIGENPAEAVMGLGNLIRNVHLEDIAGRAHRHLLFGEGDIDFAALFAALKKQGYRGHLTPDLYPFCHRPEQGLSASSEFLARHGYR